MARRVFLGAAAMVGLLGATGAAFAAPPVPQAAQAENLQHIQAEVKRLETSIRSAKETEASLSTELGRLEKLLKLQALEIQLSSMELRSSKPTCKR